MTAVMTRFRYDSGRLGAYSRRGVNRMITVGEFMDNQKSWRNDNQEATLRYLDKAIQWIFQTYRLQTWITDFSKGNFVTLMVEVDKDEPPTDPSVGQGRSD
ncbi:hypothetical protein ABW19_dt0207712 [Dactylella cylindrospora]|nr:hypothetical protein ABW19_dt0207712 [Dactylella cylindrospora]